MFNLPHLLYLFTLVPTAVFLAFILSKKLGYNKKVLYVSIGIAVLTEIEKAFALIEKTDAGYFLPTRHLPLSLCGIQLFLMIALAFAKNGKARKVLVSFMFPTLVCGALMALLIPTQPKEFGFDKFTSFRYMFSHSALIFFGLYLFLSRAIDFDLKSYAIGLSLTALLLLVSIWLNGAFQTGSDIDNEVNFMFTTRPPMPDLPILNTKNGWGFYIFNLVWIGTVLITLIYSPVIISAIRKAAGKRRLAAASEEEQAVL